MAWLKPLTMDPLSVLGLVANIIQVVDAGANAYRICHEIYTRGASIEDSRMSYTNEQLSQSYAALVRGVSCIPNLCDTTPGCMLADPS